MLRSILDPSAFRIADDYFRNSDGTSAQQISELRPQATGVHLTSREQAIPWLRANQKVSSDELAILVPGDLPVETSLEHKMVRVPCFNTSDQMVLLTCELIQLGSKEIHCAKTTHTEVKQDDASLLALTVFKQDWTVEQWNEWVNATMATFRKTLQTNGLEVLAIWGRSLRAGQTPAAPGNAESVQVHATVPTNKLDAFLNRTGFNRVYATPKLQSGRLNTSYKIVWLPDFTKAAGFAAKVPSHMGMVSGKNGLRVKESDYEQTWKLIFPSQPVPSKPKGDRVFRCDGLQFGTSHSTMEAWLEATQWPATPIRAIGPQGWLLRTEAAPPGVVMFNATPILLRELPPRNLQKQSVLVGPRRFMHPSRILSNYLARTHGWHGRDHRRHLLRHQRQLDR